MYSRKVLPNIRKLCINIDVCMHANLHAQDEHLDKNKFGKNN